MAVLWLITLATRQWNKFEEILWFHAKPSFLQKLNIPKLKIVFYDSLSVRKLGFNLNLECCGQMSFKLTVMPNLINKIITSYFYFYSVFQCLKLQTYSWKQTYILKVFGKLDTTERKNSKANSKPWAEFFLYYFIFILSCSCLNKKSNLTASVRNCTNLA